MWEFLKNDKGAGPRLSIRNPATGNALKSVGTYTENQIADALERGRIAQKKWAGEGLDRRISVLKRFQKHLVEQTDEVCRLMAMENGKPLQESLQTEVLVVNILAGYFLKRAKKLLSDQKIPMHLIKYRRSFIHYRPRGIVLLISPWNYPFSIPGGTIFMALLAGNAVIQKPASLTPLVALKTRELFDRAGLDPDLFQVLPCSGASAGKMIDMGVNFVNFTGSTEVGLSVAEKCARHLIPCSMELGGKDPAIVLDDADLDRAASGIVFGALTNAGQTCASVERVYVQEALYEPLVEKILKRVSALRLGDPLAGEIDMGPMVDSAQLAIVAEQVKDAEAKGAEILCGGKRADIPGQFYEPTVLTDVTDDMLVMREETFGPLIPVMKIESDEEAVKKANDSPYGLNAYIFSNNAKRARAMARRIEAGTVMVNETLVTFGMPETPWQGVKMSGTGRTHSDEGLRNLCYPYHINEDADLKWKWNPFNQPYSQRKYQWMKRLAKALYG